MNYFIMLNGLFLNKMYIIINIHQHTFIDLKYSMNVKLERMFSFDHCSTLNIYVYYLRDCG